MAENIEEVSVENEDEIVEIANSIESELPSSSQGRESFSNIHQVPSLLSGDNRNSFEPQLVSIGPFHRGREVLQSIEVQKFWHVRAILSRNPEMNLKNYVRQIKRLETQVRTWYSEGINLEGREFVKMMVVDGCFLLEIFLGFRNIRYALWQLHAIVGDMLLLENQLPFFVLQCMHRLVQPQSDPHSMTEHILDFFKLVLPLNVASESKERYNHLLDFYHHHCLPAPAASTTSKKVDSSSMKQLMERKEEHVKEERTRIVYFLDISGIDASL